MQGYGYRHIFRTQELRPTQSVQHSHAHGSVQFFLIIVKG